MPAERTTDSPADADLIRRCIDGNQRAWSDLYRQHRLAVARGVRRVLRRYDPDIEQDAWLRAHVMMGRGQYRGPIHRWLWWRGYQAAQSYLIDRRSESPGIDYVDTGHPDLNEISQPIRRPDEICQIRSDYRAVCAEIEKLPKAPRRALSYIAGGYSRQDLCDLAGITQMAATRAIQRGRDKLRAVMDPVCGISLRTDTGRRDQIVISMRQKGTTFRVIGERLGICWQKAREIWHRVGGATNSEMRKTRIKEAKQMRRDGRSVYQIAESLGVRYETALEYLNG